MTDRKPPERSVLDPEWEEALRRGQEAEGGAGSVEPELAVVHLFRHLRQPESLDDARVDAVWGELAGQGATPPWWKRGWWVWAPVAAAAVVVLWVVIEPRPDEPEVAVANTVQAAPAVSAPDDASAVESAAATPISATGAVSTVARHGNAALLERQFALLEPKARAEIGESIESQRDSLRYGLLDRAKGAAR